jgi:hypothetical protein
MASIHIRTKKVADAHTGKVNINYIMSQYLNILTAAADLFFRASYIVFSKNTLDSCE